MALAWLLLGRPRIVIVGGRPTVGRRLAVVGRGRGGAGAAPGRAQTCSAGRAPATTFSRGRIRAGSGRAVFAVSLEVQPVRQQVGVKLDRLPRQVLSAERVRQIGGALRADAISVRD